VPIRAVVQQLTDLLSSQVELCLVFCLMTPRTSAGSKYSLYLCQARLATCNFSREGLEQTVDWYRRQQANYQLNNETATYSGRVQPTTYKVGSVLH